MYMCNSEFYELQELSKIQHILSCLRKLFKLKIVVIYDYNRIA